MAATLIALIGVAASYGVLRQQVKDITMRQDRQDEAMDKMAGAIEKATSVGNQVELLAERSKGDQALILEKFEGLRGEVRSFMQGRESAAHAPANRPRTARRKPG
jgi:hypothetical protein